MEMVSNSHVYEIIKKVADADNYRLYLCKQKETEHQCLLQIATQTEHNGKLDRSAYILQELLRRSDELEDEYASVKTDPNIMLNYCLGFPDLVDSFIPPNQGGRRANILAFRNVETVSSMVPLINITKKDRQRIDLRTSAWIIGKLLKLLVFAHGEGISVELITGKNILIEPDNHYVLIFDWSAARIHSDEVLFETRCREISQVAQAVVIAMGGDLKAGIFPDDGEEGFKLYTEHLLRLARGSESKAGRAHEEFYKLVDSFWKREFYPFTTKPLT